MATRIRSGAILLLMALQMLIYTAMVCAATRDRKWIKLRSSTARPLSVSVCFADFLSISHSLPFNVPYPQSLGTSGTTTSTPSILELDTAYTPNQIMDTKHNPLNTLQPNQYEYTPLHSHPEGISISISFNHNHTTFHIVKSQISK